MLCRERLMCLVNIWRPALPRGLRDFYSFSFPPCPYHIYQAVPQTAGQPLALSVSSSLHSWEFDFESGDLPCWTGCLHFFQGCPSGVTLTTVFYCFIYFVPFSAAVTWSMIHWGTPWRVVHRQNWAWWGFFCLFVFFNNCCLKIIAFLPCFWEMLWSPKLSLSNIHVRLTAKGLLRNIQLLSGCRKNTVVFQAGLSLLFQC